MYLFKCAIIGILCLINSKRLFASDIIYSSEPYGRFESMFVNVGRRLRIETHGLTSLGDLTSLDLAKDPSLTNFSFTCPGSSILTGISRKKHKFIFNNKLNKSLFSKEVYEDLIKKERSPSLATDDWRYRFTCHFFRDKWKLFLLTERKEVRPKVHTGLKIEQNFNCHQDEFVNHISSEKYIEIKLNDLDDYYHQNLISSVADLDNDRVKNFVFNQLKHRYLVKDRFFQVECVKAKSMLGGPVQQKNGCTNISSIHKLDLDFNLECPRNFAITGFHSEFKNFDRIISIKCCPLQ